MAFFDSSPIERWAVAQITYSEHAISQISNTEAFSTGIDKRDRKRCIICGFDMEEGLEHAYIIPEVEDRTWELMRQRRFIPNHAKSVQHEPRNGILSCSTHRRLFDHYIFYIRWVPEVQRFIFMNHSGHPTLEEYHGRTVRLLRHDPRLPFHGAFLFHEMRVRGFWPLSHDRPILFPILWQSWIRTNSNGDPEESGDDDHTGDNDDYRHSHGSGELQDRGSRFTSASLSTLGGNSPQQSGRRYKDASGHLIDTFPRKWLILTNPFVNVAELDALKRSFAQQPNWKAAMVEGESWGGTAEENINKWKGLVGTP